MNPSIRTVACFLFATFSTTAIVTPALATSASDESAEIVIGLDADFTGPASLGGEAVRIGAETAIAEINAAGGVMGRQLALKVSDHRANPRRGVYNFEQLVVEHGAVAVLTGIHSPVAIAQLEPAHRLQRPIISPWAAATGFIDNGNEPNFAFRVSVRDAHAGGFLVAEAMRQGGRRFALMLERTAWGESNYTALTEAIEATGIGEVTNVIWFGFGATEFDRDIIEIRQSNADAIFLVANPAEGAAVIRAVGEIAEEDRPVIYSHWGIASGDMLRATEGRIAQMDVRVLQTHSFFLPRLPQTASRFFEIACPLYEVCGPEDVTAHTGMSHAYDTVHLVARAIEAAGTTDGPALRNAMLSLDRFDGIVKTYERPFQPGRQEALDRSDFKLVNFNEAGQLWPIACRAEDLIC